MPARFFRGTPLVLLALACVSFWGFARSDARFPKSPRIGGDVEFLAFDELRRSFSFSTADYGFILQENLIRNRDSQIVYAQIPTDTFIVSGNGGEYGMIEDLGDLRDSGTGTTLFWGLVIRDGVLWEAGDDVVHREASELFKLSPPDAARASAPVVLGHIYIVGIRRAAPDSSTGDGQVVYAKLRVVDLDPGKRIRVVWERL